jgi:hypothetical protein
LIASFTSRIFSAAVGMRINLVHVIYQFLDITRAVLHYYHNSVYVNSIFIRKYTYIKNKIIIVLLYKLSNN